MKKVLIIGFVWPEPSTTAAGHRMIQLIEAFQSFEWSVTFVSTAFETQYSVDLESKGVTTESILLNHSSFDTYVKKMQPDIVVFDRFMVEEQFGWRVSEQVPNALRILNTEDIHSLRKTREICHKKGEMFSMQVWKQNDMTQREIASIYRSDMSLIISYYELTLLIKELGIPDFLLQHLPFMLNVPSQAIRSEWPPFEGRSDFIVYGNGKHAPNVDAICYLKTEIWPLIKKQVPDAQVKVFGAYLPQHLMQMHQPEAGFHVLGWTKDLDAQIQTARVVLVPLHFGAGIKGKIIDALKNGTPFVSTKIGVEGMSLEALPKYCMPLDTPEAFANSAIQLYLDEKNWSEAQKKGLDALETKYSRSIWRKFLRKRLSNHIASLPEYRSKNFTGLMLRQQNLAATKYMAKWIEEKNK